jgi:2-polyprenyl-6-methoxyphenol hydroxylase-like FAD-dependent oxidoreductase
VLLVDRARFPSDTLSTHVVQPRGVAALDRWGLLERLVATGCPPIDTYFFDFGDFTLAGSPGTAEAPVAYCPRRTVLDKLLIDAAAEAGAEVREGFTVEEILTEDGRVAGVRGRTRDGRAVVERARVVVGADGRASRLAAAVRPAAYDERPPLLSAYYTYWSGLPMDGRFETYIRPYRGFAAAPTHDGLTLVIAGWPVAAHEAYEPDLEGAYLGVLALVPGFAERLRGARREAHLTGTAVPNWFRVPYGPGWALVGDAGYNKDFITAQGISDAFRDAERCARALDEWLSDRRRFEDAMADYQRDRDAASKPIFEFTCQTATLEPPSPEEARLFASLAGDRPAMDAFARLNAGTIGPPEFFADPSIAARAPVAG